jgi:hypothetical protein
MRASQGCERNTETLSEGRAWNRRIIERKGHQFLATKNEAKIRHQRQRARAYSVKVVGRIDLMDKNLASRPWQ